MKKKKKVKRLSEAYKSILKFESLRQDISFLIIKESNFQRRPYIQYVAL